MMKTHHNAVLEILNRLYKRKFGALFAKAGVNLKMIKAFQCFREEIRHIIEKLEFTDLLLTSCFGQEIPCHRYVLAVSLRFHKFFLILVFANSFMGDEYLFKLLFYSQL